ncbi:MAG: LysM peptidoglycan-binding domain-containing protein [Anaerolineae bacterium]|nr:LysM peptidoglycan-binding domain-containing protein [Anaerolineae bacterium]
MALVKVSADKRYLLNPKGQPFFAWGVNYAGYFDRAWKMWEANLFDPALIARDFRKAQNSGFNMVRLFVHTALAEELRRDNFAKLDQVLSLAQDHQLLVLLTLNDAHWLDLGRVGQLDAKIAARYKEVPTIAAYDLENEPVFYNLVGAVYPAQYRPPVHTSQLVDQYGVRVSRTEAADLQRRRQIPAHLDADKAFYYINALRIFLEYDAAANAFVRKGKGTIVDFMLSGEATPWHNFIEVLDKTVEVWLRARIDPIRAAGSAHLLTIGWNWLQFASLPANRLLDFQEYHNYETITLSGFNTNTAHLEGLRRAFPKHPLIFGEFGWSNQSSPDPSQSQPVHPALTGLYEAATYAYLRANNFAGGFKWMLNDVQAPHNPREASFGVFSAGDQPKPIRDLVLRFSQEWPPVEQPATFTAKRDLESSFAYRFDTATHKTIGGYSYQDEALRWQAEGGLAHCFIKLTPQGLLIDAQGSGRLSVDPWDLIPTWNRARETDVYRVFSDQQRTKQQTFAPGQSVELEIRPGLQYLVAMGKEITTPPPGDGPSPKPGEHVLLLGDFENYLPAALKYIRRFAPDLTFTAEEVGERWAYVTVVAPPERISDTRLDDIRGAGALLVERVSGPTPQATQAILDDLAQRSQRFLTTLVPSPPQEEPPTDSPELPPGDDIQDTYIVQPGDTLSKIALRFYGNAALWTFIFEANRDKLSSPGLLRVGMELRIPERA